MTDSAYAVYVGIDWATAAHQVTVLDPARRVLAERSVPHTGEALAECVAWLSTLADGRPERIAVAIEVPRGAVVDSLLERGCAVFALNPKQLDRFRDRHTVAGAKDDRRDAFVLADALRTDRPAFRQLQPEDPLIIQLRDLSRLDQDLLHDLTRLSNRLREQLLRFFPQPLALCPAADEPWLWALLELAPAPAPAARLTRAKLEKLLRAGRIRRFTAADLWTVLQTPALRVASGTTEAASSHLTLLVAQLRLVHTQRKTCGSRLDALLTRLQHRPDDGGAPGATPDVAVLRSAPGIGRGIAATLLAEGGRPLADRDLPSLRAQAGIAPVTQQSGKRCVVRMRFGCNGRLRNALYHWGRIAVQIDPRARTHYQALRQRGQSHGRALRGVVDRLLAMLMAMLRTGTCYDATRRRAPVQKPA